MFKMLATLWATIEMFLSAFGRTAKAADLAGQALEHHAAIIAEEALLNRTNKLNELNLKYGLDVKALT